MSNKLEHKIFIGGGFPTPPPVVPSLILKQDGDAILTQNNNRLIQQNYG